MVAEDRRYSLDAAFISKVGALDAHLGCGSQSWLARCLCRIVLLPNRAMSSDTKQGGLPLGPLGSHSDGTVPPAFLRIMACLVRTVACVHSIGRTYKVLLFTPSVRYAPLPCHRYSGCLIPKWIPTFSSIRFPVSLCPRSQEHLCGRRVSMDTSLCQRSGTLMNWGCASFIRITRAILLMWQGD